MLNTSKTIRVSLLWGALLLSALPLFSQTAKEICDNGLDDDGDGYVDCYDFECNCSPDPDCYGVVPDVIAARLQWRSQPKLYKLSSVPLVGNMNPQSDNIPEIIVVPKDTTVGGSLSYFVHIYSGDGANAHQPDIVHIADGIALEWTEPVVIGDLDGNGSPELVLISFTGYILVYRNFTPGAQPAMQLWLKSDFPINGPGSRVKRPHLADLNGDGISEIIGGNNIFQLELSDPTNIKLKRVVFAGLTLPDGKFLDGFVHTDVFNTLGIADLVTVADCNGDPDCDGLEIAAGRAIYAVDLDPNDGDGIQIKMVRNLTQMTPQMSWGDGLTAVADVDLDGVPDVVVISRRFQGFAETWGMYIWNKNGLLKFWPFPSRTGFAIPSIANVYDDTKHGFALDLPEIIMDVEDELVCFNLNAASLNATKPWWWTLPSNNYQAHAGAFPVFDFNGDGLAEILFRDREELRILYGGGQPYPPNVDTQRNWWKIPLGLLIGIGYPVVADADNDGEAEIILTGQDVYSGLSFNYLQVFKSAFAPWMPCRPIWHQFNYNPVMINDDLSLPKMQQKHWLESPPGSGKYPFNNQFTQVSPLRQNGQYLYPVPDAIALIDSTYCDQQELYLVLRVCNQGSATLQDSLPLQFYQNDPTTAAAIRYGDPFYLPAPVKPDACTMLTVNVPLPSGGTLWGVLNDNGTGTLPLQISTDLPLSFLPECDYTNNLFSLNMTAPSGNPDLGSDTVLCAAATKLLSAGPDYARYRWQDGSSGSTFTATGPGQYWVDAWDICGNKYTDTLHISAAPPLTSSQTILLYPGQSVVLNGQTYTQPGTVVVTKPAPGGCDSVITYILEPGALPEDPCDVKNTACVKFEILGIAQNAKKQKTYRMRVTNNCANKLVYATFQLPNGMTAKQPSTGTIYTAPSGRQYEVRNPNHSPAHSIRFKTIGDGIANGAFDIFEYTLPAQADPAFIYVTVRMEPQVYAETHLNVFGCTVEQTANRPEETAQNRAPESNATDRMLRIYPNPVAEVLVVEKAGNTDVEAVLISATGQVFNTIRLEGTTTQVNVASLPSGIWFLKTTDGNVARFVRL